MKKLTLIMSLLALLLLAACGTDTSNENDTSNNEETTSNDNGDTTENNEKDTETNTDDKNTETDSNSATEKQLTYQLNGKTVNENATLVTSDNQGYTMYVLPEFTLTGEEPRKDTLYVTDSDEIFMRIELLEDDVDWETYEQNIAVELEYYNSNITEPTDASLQIDNASIHEASNGQETATIYLIKDEKQPMKLTIFTKADQDYRSAFVEMAKTITKE